MPPRENAIYQLTAGLDRLARFEFPAKLNETTRAFFARRASLEPDPKIAADMKEVGQGIIDPPAVQRLSASPLYNATLRTTCVTTMLHAGEAEAALPQRAQATVQCRLLPGELVSDVQVTLVNVIADSSIKVSAIDHPTEASGSPLRQDVLRAVERVTAELWPGVPVVPAMDPWSSDSFYLRRAGIPSYGVSGVFTDQDSNGAHGRDEHVGVQAFHDGVEFTYRLMKALTR
jgi:acetylornithine deacetylase/succinyl-diaminopimelate desuccinylase-like protein